MLSIVLSFILTCGLIWFVVFYSKLFITLVAFTLLVLGVSIVFICLHDIIESIIEKITKRK